MIFRLVPLLLTALLISGCLSRPPAPTSLQGLTHWQAEGKIGLRSASGGGNFLFVWRQDGERYRLALSGPLGVGRSELDVGPNGVVLHHAELGELTAASPEALLEQTTGHRAPVSLLAHWIKAEAASPAATLLRSDEGVLLHIKEEGWTAEFAEWQPGSSRLPRRILITGPDTRLTVFISGWQTPRP
ncbi:MAG: lipoprotein insertase outer membrane protein LolB [Moraxellaceae bacterium]|nr:lipoprotein insertase outer membrane protein LolB [Moraxellaceae bacterium]